MRAWTELKAEGVRLPDYPRIVRAGLSDDDKVAHVLALNLARRHLTPKQRAEVVGMLRVKGWSLRRIAGVAGISEGTVRRDLGAIASDYAIDLPDQKGESDGIHPTQKPVATLTGPLRWHMKPAEVCFEPFSGSGTCIIAAEMAARPRHETPRTSQSGADHEHHQRRPPRPPTGRPLSS